MLPEAEYGNVEYKLKLNPARVESLASQLRYRLREGDGIAVYYLGVRDDGTPVGISDENLAESLRVLSRVAELADAVVVSKRALHIKGRRVYEVILRERALLPREEVCVIAVGNVDAGKTTLIASLVTGECDDGSGRLLPYVSRFPHEVKYGRTSSVARVLLGFSADGNVVNHVLPPDDEAEVARHSSKAIRFIDIGGHERYLRTAARGFMSSLADYAMYVISYPQALALERYPMAREHLGLVIVFNLPFFIVFTKRDLVQSEEMADEAVEKLSSIIRRFKYIPIRVRDAKEPIESLARLTLRRFVPIFEVSNVTREGHDQLLRYLSSLPRRSSLEREVTKAFLMYVDEIWTPKGQGLVVGGLVLRGRVRRGEEVLMGPLDDGSWRLVRARSLRVHDVNVRSAHAGQYVTIALDGLEREEIRKGMALLSKDSKPLNIRSFSAKVWILHHPTTIREGYQTVAHIHAVRWPVVFDSIESDRGDRVLRTGDIGNVTLRFHPGRSEVSSGRPWHIEAGMRLLLRDGRCRAVGVVQAVAG
ncbi:MAG: GTP-binding protein [Thermoprotei archaeon]|nr:MAG: GTP-binding protein [Thermoprotei archaeon]